MNTSPLSTLSSVSLIPRRSLLQAVAPAKTGKEQARKRQADIAKIPLILAFSASLSRWRHS